MAIVGGTAWNLPVRCMVYDASGLVWIAEQQPLLKTDSLTVTIGNPSVTVLNNLIPVSFDYLALTYTGIDMTGVVYKTGGSGGTTVATLTLAYDGSHVLQTVTRS